MRGAWVDYKATYALCKGVSKNISKKFLQVLRQNNTSYLIIAEWKNKKLSNSRVLK